MGHAWEGWSQSLSSFWGRVNQRAPERDPEAAPPLPTRVLGPLFLCLPAVLEATALNTNFLGT